MERREEDYPLSHENWVRSRAFFGERHLEQNDMLRELDPEFADLCIRLVHEHMYPRQVLPQKVRELCAVAALTVLDTPQLGPHIKAAIQAGATREEAAEAVFQMLTYAGVPRTLNGVAQYRRAIAELAEADPGSSASRPPQPPRPLKEDGLTIDERAMKTGTRLYGEAQTRYFIDELEAVDPAFNRMFKELTYAGMYSRTVLDPKVRQLLAVAACTVSNALPQLESHARAGLRVGLTVEEIREVIFQMVVYVGMPFTVQAFRRFQELVKKETPAT
jgi:alkylhydroperoxidase/carboxymuconolactone decarboxylase family protein YurZ